MKTLNKIFTAAALITFASFANAQTGEVTDFVAGTPATAASVNANFDALIDAIDALNARVDSLESPELSLTKLAGSTYCILNLGIEAEQGNNYASIGSWVDTGTVTFNGDATQITGAIGTGAGDGSWFSTWSVEFQDPWTLDGSVQGESGESEDLVLDITGLTGNILTLDGLGALAFSSDGSTFYFGGSVIGEDTSILIGVKCN